MNTRTTRSPKSPPFTPYEREKERVKQVVEIQLRENGTDKFKTVEAYSDINSSVEACLLFFLGKVPPLDEICDIWALRKALKQNSKIYKNLIVGDSGYLFMTTTVGMYRFVPVKGASDE